MPTLSISKRLTCTPSLLLCLAGTTVVAQAPADSLKNQFRRYATQTLQEKLFLHLDRPTYLCGEVMWFKVYAVDGTYHRPLATSKVAYVEVLDRAHRPVLQGKVALEQATGKGSFVLPVSLASGTYTVRAYTSWMKNFSPDFYYQTTASILNPAAASSQSTAKDTLAYDIQFFPEGGNLVRAIRSKVAFKIADRKGRSLDTEGTVLDEQGVAVARFRTLKFGLGSFSFTPSKAGSSYTATIKLPNGQLITRKLPPVYEQGMVIHLEESTPEQFTISVKTTGLGTGNEPVYLVGHARQQVIVSAASSLSNGEVSFQVRKQDVPEGISHFTVFNSRQQPVCERLYFRRPSHTLLVSAAADKRQYLSRDQVRLQPSTGTMGRTQVPANLSVAVYRLDSLSTTPQANIAGYLWLSSDIKGHIENPDYYLTSTEAVASEAADNLMLTQGWSRFKWTDVLAAKPLTFAYLPEINGHLIRGRVVNTVTGDPVPHVAAYLTTPNRQGRLFSGVSKADGSILFDVKDYFGLNELVVQTNSLQDTTSRVEVLNPFSVARASVPAPYFPLPLTLRYEKAITQRFIQTQLQTTYYQRYNSHYQLPAPDTLSYLGKPDEHYNLDEYIRFPTMEDIMREYVPGVAVRRKKDGFHFLVIDLPYKTVFFANPLVLLDGVPAFNINKIMAMDPLKIQKLDVYTRHYFVGQRMFDGLVSYTTYKGDLGGFQFNPKVLIQEYEGLQYQREFYAPRYETAEQRESRLPDFRNLLYWNPSVTTSAGTQTPLEFYTSDQVGNYLVVVQGMAADGAVGSTNFVVEVKPAPKS